MASAGKILVVDDESDTVDLIRLTLETANYEVKQALDGPTALDLIDAEHFDVVLLDIMMPEMSGFDVVQQLNALSRERPPIIFLTAKKDSEDRSTGRDLGAAAYLTKPTKRGDLLDAIREAMGES